MFSFLSGNRKELSYSLIIYIFSLFVLFSIKPSFAYNDKKEMKGWGIGEDKTIFPIYIISIIISILSLFFLTILNIAKE